MVASKAPPPGVELEDDLRGLCAENIAFQRYYELKKQGRHFKVPWDRICGWGGGTPKVYKSGVSRVGISSLRILRRTDCTQRGVRRGPRTIVCSQPKRGGTILNEFISVLAGATFAFDSVISTPHFLSPQSLRLVHPPLFPESYRSDYRLDFSPGLPIPIPPPFSPPIPQFIKHAPCHPRAPPPRSGCGRSSRRIARTTTSHGWSTCPPPSARAPRGPVRQEAL